MLRQNDVFFTAGSREEDVIYGGHPKQIFGPSYFVRALWRLEIGWSGTQLSGSYRAVVSGDAGGALASPEFGSSVNPIRLCP